MFQHHGKTRTIEHNKEIASLLSLVAGMVNVVGFLSVQRLTTNVTGHFAFFVDEIFKFHFSTGFIYFLYILFFFLGSFFSSILIEVVIKKNEKYTYVIPTLFESSILISIGFLGHTLVAAHSNLIAFSLLFAMGLQNSFVTRISDTMVRTTHLTGLFTDLGIESAQLFFYKQNDRKQILVTTIKLRLRIILFFFMGGIIGGILYTYWGMFVLIIAALLLLFGLIYDGLKLRLASLQQKNKTQV